MKPALNSEPRHVLASRLPAIGIALCLTVAGQAGEPDVAAWFAGAKTLEVGPVRGPVAGVALDQDRAWLLVRGAAGASDTIVGVDRATGKAKSTTALDGAGAVGLCSDGEALWVLSASADRFLRKVGTDGQAGRTVRLREHPGGRLCGLGIAGDTFVFAANRGGRATVYSYRPTTWKLARLFTLDGPAHALTVHGRTVAVYQRRFDTYAHHWLYLFELGGEKPRRRRFLNLNATGLASDGRTLAALEPQGRGVRIVPFVVPKGRPVVVGDPVRRRMELTFAYTNGNRNPFRLDLWVPVPATRSFQSVSNVCIEPKPRGDVRDRYGNRWAHIRWPKVVEGCRAAVRFDIVTTAVAQTIDPYYRLDRADLPAAVLETHTAETHCFDLSHPAVRETARKVKRGRTLLEHVLNVRDTVNDALEVQGPSGPSDRASAYLSGGEGRCYGHTLAFAAVARSCGLPARAVGGVYLEGRGPEGDELGGHTWNQVYAPGAGWVNIDAQLDDRGRGRHSYRYVGYRSNRYVITFIGAYDRRNGKDVFAERCWYRHSERIYREGQVPEVVAEPVRVSSSPLPAPSDEPAER
jgi:transglutaminase-like putative cysteine protease